MFNSCQNHCPRSRLHHALAHVHSSNGPGIISDFLFKISQNMFGIVLPESVFFHVIQIMNYRVTWPLHQLKKYHWTLSQRHVPQFVHQAGLPEMVAKALDELKTFEDTFILCILSLITKVNWPRWYFSWLWQEEGRPSLRASLSCYVAYLMLCFVISSIQAQLCFSWGLLSTQFVLVV